jgi:hypothetical protein
LMPLDSTRLFRRDSRCSRYVAPLRDLAADEVGELVERARRDQRTRITR